jgi:chromosome segregation ATPase
MIWLNKCKNKLWSNDDNEEESDDEIDLLKFRLFSVFFTKWVFRFYVKKRTSKNIDLNVEPRNVLLHIQKLISENAKKEADIENKEKAIKDLASLIKDAKSKVSKSKQRYESAVSELKRVEKLNSETVAGYEDQLAQLKMQINSSKDIKEKQLEEMKEKLKNIKYAKGKQAINNTESMEAIKGKIQNIQKEIQRKKNDALKIRSDCMSYNKQCEEIAKEVDDQMIEKETLVEITNKLEEKKRSLSNNDITELVQQKNTISEQILKITAKISENESTLEELKRTIHDKERELKIEKEKCIIAQKAFESDGSEEEDI